MVPDNHSPETEFLSLFMITRRTALKLTATAAAAAALSPVRLLADPHVEEIYPFKLPALPYAKEALEPHFDAKTMEIHHDKHHQAYVDNLNKALADYPDLQKKSLEDLLRNLDQVPEKIRNAVRNHGGGHYNHSLFWQSLAAAGSNGEPSERVKAAFGELYPTVEEIEENFLKTTTGLFGSGWVWVTVTKAGQFKYETSPNQDVPFGSGKMPLFGLDVWEHAYYLKYQNKRADYAKAFTKIINWNFVNARFEKYVG